MDSLRSSMLLADDSLRQDQGVTRLSDEGQASEMCHSPNLFKTNSMTDLSSPKMTESSARNVSRATSPLTIPSQGESEVFEFSMNDGSEDSHFEEESSFIQRIERRRILLRTLMDMVYSTCTCAVTSGAMEDGESGSSSAPGGEPSFGSPPSSQQNKDDNFKGKRPLPRSDSNNEEEEDDDQQRQKRRKSTTNNDGTDAAERFACPYYQRNRRLHLPPNCSFKGSCYGPGFMSVHRVKEHLSRAHMLPPYCTRCNATFDSDLSLEKHTRQDPPCQLIAKLSREGIGPTTEKLIRVRNKEYNSKTEPDRWRHIYCILFPADNLTDLPSPYYGNYLETNLAGSSPETKPTAKSYDEFLQRELYRRIYRVLENKVDDTLDSAEKSVVDTLKGQLEGIIRDVQTQLYEEFKTTFRTGENQALDGNDENAT
ncbi:hypothetical protein F4811DRAFT_573808 [Daldinia bambusicola]|nr:hypothetical protein F4811DRAFT_573808 [Daldinia bambusicola]